MASRGINKVILVGNVGGDPETRFLPSGGAVANITVATSQAWKDKTTGEQKEVTEWHRVVFFNRLAEVVGEYVKKGAKLYIEGSLRTRSWEQDGIKRYATEIVGAEMQMLDGKSDAAAAPSHAQNYEQQRAANTAPASEQFGGMDDDIPFMRFAHGMELAI